MEVKVYLLLSRRGLTLCFYAVFVGVYQGTGVCFGSFVVSLYSVGKKCAIRALIICGIMVMYKEFFVMMLTYGRILSFFWCPAISAVVRMWRTLCYLWVTSLVV